MKKFIIFLLIPCLLLSNLAVIAKHLYPEKAYQRAWCNKYNGKTEVVLGDNTRIDCELPEYVVEFDFAKKVYESIGQAYHYAALTGKKPGIVLIIENPEDSKYLNRIHGIKTWTMTPDNLK